MVDTDLAETRAAQISERTPLQKDDLQDGAVDVAWFWRAYRTLGPERWALVYAKAKYATSGAGHTRAKLFADAMLGELDEHALITRVATKRHQDSVRALGLLPVEPGPEGAKQVQARYTTIREFVHGSRKFGSQRQASEKRAASIAMQNLARTAGYADPLRLEWAMEAASLSDLAAGPVMVATDDVVVSLSIDGCGDPRIAIQRGEKTLKAVPAKLRKLPEIKGLKERKKEITHQAARMRVSLEEAMCRLDTFQASDLRELVRHPVLRPMLSDLVFASDEERLGYPADDVKNLISHDGTQAPLTDGERLHLAHPIDLLESGEWHLWQSECFMQGRKQPFKQVFRELYLLTDTERASGNRSLRYAGHQVQSRQALALLGKRGWIANQEEGLRRTFHEERITAWIEVMGLTFTPADVEDLTIESVCFTPRGEWKLMDMSNIPPRLFSEVMRDLDLVVSVAHRGGVDPETSASTIEMRTALIRETLDMLDIHNVTLKNSHALIEGKLGSYSVHLGSAIVHRQPGGAVCVVPVHSQHRGRIFLPFVDDDPRTAEVLSKVLLLVRDDKISDPTILEQLRH